MTYKFDIAGKTFEVPGFQNIPAGALRKARHATDEIDKAFTILETVLGEDSDVIEALDSLTLEQLGEWLSGWTQGVPLGESNGSSN